jgi:hypothetical protein
MGTIKNWYTTYANQHWIDKELFVVLLWSACSVFLLIDRQLAEFIIINVLLGIRWHAAQIRLHLESGKDTTS